MGPPRDNHPAIHPIPSRQPLIGLSVLKHSIERFGISSPSARHQLVISSSLARHQLVISSSSARHQLVISSSSARHHFVIISSSARHQFVISSSSGKKGIDQRSTGSSK